MDDHRQLHHQKKHSAVVGRGLPEHINQAKIEWFTWKFDSTRMSMLKKKKNTCSVTRAIGAAFHQLLGFQAHLGTV